MGHGRWTCGTYLSPVLYVPSIQRNCCYSPVCPLWHVRSATSDDSPHAHCHGREIYYKYTNTGVGTNPRDVCNGTTPFDALVFNREPSLTTVQSVSGLLLHFLSPLFLWLLEGATRWHFACVAVELQHGGIGILVCRVFGRLKSSTSWSTTHFFSFLIRATGYFRAVSCLFKCFLPLSCAWSIKATDRQLKHEAQVVNHSRAF
ncbi:unnamed protein product [Scytosiphon promiscuus]